jgi:hypothetical protein
MPIATIRAATTRMSRERDIGDLRSGEDDRPRQPEPSHRTLRAA